MTRLRPLPVPFGPLVAALALAALSLGGVACGAPPVRVTSGDEAPEAYVGQSRLREVFSLEDGWWVSPVLEAPAGATRVAVWLSTSEDAVDAPLSLEARGYTTSGAPTAWHPVQERWAEAPQRVLRADLGELVTAIELRVHGDDADKLARVVYSAVTPDPVVAARVDASQTAAISGAAPRQVKAALDIAGIEPRAAWNARADGGCDSNTNKDWISVHHSVSALQDGASQATHAAAVRGIQSYHMDGRGYCDIGYHFATTADGTVWEAREAKFLGAHTGSHNTNNAGIVFIGCFHPTADCNGLGATTPPQVMLEGGGGAIGRIAAHYGITIGGSTVIGHRDNPDQTTSCPGDNLHDLLGTLRSIAQGGGVDPPPPATGTVQGTVWDLSITTDIAQSEALGARLPGATLTVTGGPTTPAREGDSYWSFDLAPGTYTVTATLAGFAPASREVQVTAGAEVWASIGIAPLADAVGLTVRVLDADDGHLIENASVVVSGVDPQQTDATGTVQVALAAGDVTIAVSAEGYESQTVTRTLAAGVDQVVDVSLVPETIIKPGEGEGEHPVGGDQPVQRVTILPPEDGGGCASTDPDESGPLVMLFVSLALLSATQRRRPVLAR